MSWNPPGTRSTAIVVTIIARKIEPRRVPRGVPIPPTMDDPPTTTAPTDWSRNGVPISRNAPLTAQSSEEAAQDVGYARGLLDFYSREIRGTRILPDGGKLTPVNRAVHKP